MNAAVDSRVVSKSPRNKQILLECPSLESRVRTVLVVFLLDLRQPAGILASGDSSDLSLVVYRVVLTSSLAPSSQVSPNINICIQSSRFIGATGIFPDRIAVSTLRSFAWV